jgi:hypothetical protein
MSPQGDIIKVARQTMERNVKGAQASIYDCWWSGVLVADKPLRRFRASVFVVHDLTFRNIVDVFWAPL